MTVKERLDLLSKLKATHDELFEVQLPILQKSLGMVYESPLWEAVETMHERYIDAVAALIGDDTFDWLHWYIYDNDWGEKGYEATSPGGKIRKVKTFKQLLKIIDESK